MSPISPNKKRNQLETEESSPNNDTDQKTEKKKHEISIDIHIKHLVLKVHQKLPLRVIYTRGKKIAKTQVKVLSASIDKAVFDEKFQVNTMLELDPDTNLPLKEKISKLGVQLDKSYNGIIIGEVEFNMTDYQYG